MKIKMNQKSKVKMMMIPKRVTMGMKMMMLMSNLT